MRIVLNVVLKTKQYCLEPLQKSQHSHFFPIISSLILNDFTDICRALENELQQGRETISYKFLPLGDIDSI